MKERIRVAVLFGGRSAEHDVSIQSARSVLGALDPQHYEAAPIYIDPMGRWNGLAETQRMLEFGQYPARPPDTMSASTGMTIVKPIPPPSLAERLEAVDVVFPLIHGPNGEDGTIQGLLELAGMPYVGAGVLGSAVGMDKAVMKDLFRQHGLQVAASLLCTRFALERDRDGIHTHVARDIGFPCFVKPVNMGSSVGVSKVHKQGELDRALKIAARYDRRILIEQAIQGREIEVAVLGNDAPVASVPGEVVPQHEFYDYVAKYVDASSLLYIPASLPQDQVTELQRMAVVAFTASDCAGMARVDFFVNDDQIYVNEINTIPGFTRISMYPKLWEASGVAYADLVDRLVRLALERHAEKARSQTQWDGATS